MSGPKIMPGAQKELDHFFDIPWCRDQFLHPDAVAVPRLDDKQDGRGSTGKLFSDTQFTVDHLSSHRPISRPFIRDVSEAEIEKEMVTY